MSPVPLTRWWSDLVFIAAVELPLVRSVLAVGGAIKEWLDAEDSSPLPSSWSSSIM